MPGPVWLKIILLILLFLIVVAVLFTWVFPAIAPYMPFNQGTVGALSGGVLPPVSVL